MDELSNANVDAVIVDIQTKLSYVLDAQQATQTLITTAQLTENDAQNNTATLITTHNTLEELVRRLWAHQEEDDS